MRKIFNLLICAILFPAFSFGQVEKDSAAVVETRTRLGVGQDFLFGKTGVKFVKVLSDSRCPKQVTCIWAGEAKVLLRITTGGEYIEKEVIVSGSGAELALEDDLQLLISRLRPYPEAAKGIPSEEYCLSIATVPSRED